MSIDPQYGPGPGTGTPMGVTKRASRIDPHLVFGVSLLIGLALSWPSLSGAMHGTTDIVQAGIHLLVAVAISWAGCYGLGSLVLGYANTPAPSQHNAAQLQSQQRRADDMALQDLIDEADAA